MQVVRKRTVTGNNSQGAKGRWANNQLGHEGFEAQRSGDERSSGQVANSRIIGEKHKVD